MRTTTAPISILVLVLFLGACGKKEEAAAPAPAPSPAPAPAPTPAPTPAPASPEAPASAEPAQPTAAAPAATAPAAGQGRCELTVTGDATFSGVGAGGTSSVIVGYWYSEDEAKKAYIAKDDPNEANLLINCLPAGAKVSFVPSRGSTTKDIPFGPGKYALAKGRSKPGQFTVLMTIGKDPYGSAEGTLEISKMDATGIAGTATFTAESIDVKNKKKISVTAKFDYPCGAGTEMCKKGGK
jgi:hypothetical protein